MARTITIAGRSFAADAEHLGLLCAAFAVDDLRRLAAFFAEQGPRSASFGDSNLDDEGLALVSGLATLEGLDLQGTRISNAGLSWLARLPRLRRLRLKDNPQLTNACIPALARLTTLVDLQVHETAIDQAGLAGLTHLTGLRDVLVEDDAARFTFAGLAELSMRMPGCTFLVKGRGEFRAGRFTGSWPGSEGATPR